IQPRSISAFCKRPRTRCNATSRLFSGEFVNNVMNQIVPTCRLRFEASGKLRPRRVGRATHKCSIKRVVDKEPFLVESLKANVAPSEHSAVRGLKADSHNGIHRLLNRCPLSKRQPKLAIKDNALHFERHGHFGRFQKGSLDTSPLIREPLTAD